MRFAHEYFAFAICAQVADFLIKLFKMTFYFFGALPRTTKS